MLSTAKLLALAVSKKLKIFLWKNPSCSRKSKIWTFWEILLMELHSMINLLPLAVFETSRSFFEEKISFFFQTNANFRMFWEILLIQLHSTPTLLPLVIFKFFIFFSKNPSVLFKKIQNWTFWELSKFQLHFSAYLKPVAICLEKKDSP